MTKTKAFILAVFAFGLMIPVWSCMAGDTAENVETSKTGEIVYLPREMITVETKAGQDYLFEVEVAANGSDQSRGLMYRTHLNNDSGMLFLFDDEDDRSFWMKNTLIPLDMIFVGRDGVINHIHHNAKPQDDTRITAERPAMAVLEINGGLAGTLNIKEGDRIIHPAFRNVLAPQ